MSVVAEESAPKDYEAILSRYKFEDELGHALENCQDFHDLLDENRRLRKQCNELLKAQGLAGVK